MLLHLLCSRSGGALAWRLSEQPTISNQQLEELFRFAVEPEEGDHFRSLDLGSLDIELQKCLLNLSEMCALSGDLSSVLDRSLCKLITVSMELKEAPQILRQFAPDPRD